MLPGSDPKLKDEYVIYVAHWDHFGMRDEVVGSKIYHGAKDNASGTAALLELARAFKRLKTPPRRSVLFLAVTAEEQGLLGSRYYAEHPLYPLARTAAVINMDAINVLGRTSDIVMIGRGSSTLDEVVESVAREQGRAVHGDPEPERVSSTAPTTSASPNRACRHLTRTRASSTWADHRTGALGCASGIPRRTTTNRLT